MTLVEWQGLWLVYLGPASWSWRSICPLPKISKEPASLPLKGLYRTCSTHTSFRAAVTLRSLPMTESLGEDSVPLLQSLPHHVDVPHLWSVWISKPVPGPGKHAQYSSHQHHCAQTHMHILIVCNSLLTSASQIIISLGTNLIHDFMAVTLSVKLAFFREKRRFPWNPWFFVNFSAFSLIYDNSRVLSAAFVRMLLFATCRTSALSRWHWLSWVLT